MTKQAPHEIIVDNIVAKIWENVGGGGKTFLSVSIVRIYKDENGELQESGLIAAKDIPKVTIAAQKAYEFIVEVQYLSDQEGGEVARCV